ncbi:PIN domain-containing protein [Streptomyces abikoensis]|uniref:PIN domain-containing protein n=1 Tax=Streptomyces abikoensis TaxID=97398 RepID=A0ABW7SUP3_9ACTN
MTPSASGASMGGGYGLFDGFEGYRTPSSDDYRHVLAKGMVVFDANVLLNLYRYTEETRDGLFTIMETLGERFWVPHQAVAEFWRNRESTLNTPKDSAKVAETELRKAERTATNAIQVWAKSSALPDERRSEIIEHFTSVFEKICKVINEQAENDTIPHARDTNKDALLSRLSNVLAGRVGSPLSEEDHAIALKEAKRRAQAKEPPGYLDQEKNGDLGAGDYIVWEQLLIEATRRQCDVLFVTNDLKEDWWRKVRDQQRGPRLELQSEFRSRTRQQLFMLQHTGLLVQASSPLNMQIIPESVEESERTDRLVTAQLPPEAREKVLFEIYRQAHEMDWDFLSNTERSNQYRQWVEDPEVGGVLQSFMTEQKARVWIKDVPMREYARAQEGFGQYAPYTVMRFRGPDEVVKSACGPEWDVEPDSMGEKPMHCYATNGTTTRYVCWGHPRTFRDLIGAALNKTIESKERPAIVVTTRDGDTAVTTEEQHQQTQLAERSGIDLEYLHRSMIPNPEYPM